MKLSIWATKIEIELLLESIERTVHLEEGDRKEAAIKLQHRVKSAFTASGRMKKAHK